MADLYLQLLLLATGEIEEREYMKQRIYRHRMGALEMEEVECMTTYHLPKAVILTLIEDLRPALPVQRRRSSLSVEVIVLTALRFYAAGSYQRVVGEERSLSLSQKSVSRCIRLVSNAMSDLLLPRWVKFPSTPTELAAKTATFDFKYHIPGVVGVLHCLDVRIVPPPKDHPLYPEHIYVNHQGTHSLNVQFICDDNLEIINVVPKYPGGSDDCHIWRNSRVRAGIVAQHERGETTTRLIGDSGYPLEPWLMTPILDAAPETPEARYNEAHCAALKVVERFNAAFTGRWRCINGERALHYMPSIASKIVASCVVLHNIATFYQVPLPSQLPNHPQTVVHPAIKHQGNNPLLNQGRAARDFLIAKFFR